VIGRMDIEKRLGQLATNLEQALQKRLWPLRDTAAVHAAMDAVRPLAAAMSDRPRKLVHGDLHIRNVIADTAGTITGVIDWGDVHIGDPALDLSIVYSYVPPEARSLFFAAYGETDDAALRLARFFAIFVGFSLLVYGHDRGNLPLAEAAKSSIRNALQPDCYSGSPTSTNK
jgi:aminoglycoside phosphotransferase (APT) family kinase protein